MAQSWALGSWGCYVLNKKGNHHMTHVLNQRLSLLVVVGVVLFGPAEELVIRALGGDTLEVADVGQQPYMENNEQVLLIEISGKQQHLYPPLSSCQSC
jgi:hypothetical protein